MFDSLSAARRTPPSGKRIHVRRSRRVSGSTWEDLAEGTDLLGKTSPRKRIYLGRSRRVNGSTWEDLAIPDGVAGEREAGPDRWAVRGQQAAPRQFDRVPVTL